MKIWAGSISENIVGSNKRTKRSIVAVSKASKAWFGMQIFVVCLFAALSAVLDKIVCRYCMFLACVPTCLIKHMLRLFFFHHVFSMYPGLNTTRKAIYTSALLDACCKCTPCGFFFLNSALYKLYKNVDRCKSTVKGSQVLALFQSKKKKTSKNMFPSG